MKQLALIVTTLALGAPLAMAQTTTWVSDPMHSEVDFTITHLAITDVHGRFGKVDAQIQLDSADMQKSTVKATIDVTGVDTGEAPRDGDLKSPRFFDAGQFATATFTSTSVAKTSSGLTVNGNLTLHGITKPVVLTVDGPKGPVQGMDKKQHAGFSATTTISRTAFGIGAGVPAAMVGDDVKITISLDVAKQ